MMLVALLSAVLLGSVQDASCTMHGLGVTGADMTAGRGMAHHAGMAGMTHDAGSTDSGEHHGCCTCIGDCRMVAPLVSAPTTATRLVTVVVPEPAQPLDAEPRRPPSVEPDRRLPFANGPPRLALV